MKAHTWADGGYGMVTGCDDPDVALDLLAELLADHHDWYGAPVEEVREALSNADIRVERGRILPEHPDADLAWTWWPNLHPDRPGATTAVVFYYPRRATA